MKKVANIYFFSIMCAFLGANLGANAQGQKMLLSETEVLQLLKLLESKEHGKDNWHVKYSKQLNDSSCLLNIARNDHTPNDDTGLCKILTFKKDKVFIYGSSCRTTIPSELKNGRKHSPFFIPDAQYWHILAMKRKENINFYEVKDLQPEDHNTLKGLTKW